MNTAAILTIVEEEATKRNHEVVADVLRRIKDVDYLNNPGVDIDRCGDDRLDMLIWGYDDSGHDSIIQQACDS